MKNAIQGALTFMNPNERFRFYVFLVLRAVVGVFDLVAILAIGVLSSSIALLLTNNGDTDETLNFGPVSLQLLETQTIPIVGVFILTLFVSKAILSIYFTHKLAHFLARIEARAAREITSRAFGDGLEGIKKYSRNEIVFAVQSGSPAIFNTLLNSLGVLISEGFLFLIVIATFATLSPVVAIVTLLYFGLVGVVIQFFIGRQLEKTSSQITALSIRSNGNLLDLGEVIREASTLGKTSYFVKNIFEARYEASRKIATQLVLQSAPRHILETALIVGISVFIFAQSLTGDLESAAVVIGVFLAGGLRLTAALLPLQGALLAIKQAIPLSQRAFKFLELPVNDQAPQDIKPANKLPSSAVSVSVRNLSFCFDESHEPALRNVSLKIASGSQVAFIGPSGAGKTTLADLVLGLLKPTTGEICLDELPPSLWNERFPGLVGYVPQKPGMVSGTIAENIALGIDPSQVDDLKLKKAIQDANLSGLIESLPKGAATDVGAGKDALSGGQIQRIGLARALYTEPRLLVMDEATSALDAESEHEINQALDKMRGKVTVILIAHRLNTIQRSDLVFLLEKGSLTATGTFPELVKTNRTVKKLSELMAIQPQARN